jgi:hypothetical protein
LAPSQVEILKKELNQLIEADFVVLVVDSMGVSLVEIVPKKNGKWNQLQSTQQSNKKGHVPTSIH